VSALRGEPGRELRRVLPVATGEGACPDFTFVTNVVRQRSMRGYISSAPKAFGGAHQKWTFECNIAASQYKAGWQ
jgi:hypothetical protein